MSAVDINGDSHIDIVGFLGVYIFLLLNNGNGGFEYILSRDLDRNWWAQSFSDVDNDGDADVVAVDRSNDRIGILRNIGEGEFGSEVFYLAGRGPVSSAIADFNLDGYNDVAVANSGFDVSSSSSLAVLINKGNGDFMHRLTFKAGNCPSYVCTADFDNDGDFDIAMSDYQDNTVSFYLNRTIE